MRLPRNAVFRRIVVPLLAAVGLTLTAASPALAHPYRYHPAPATYLALGDSVPFGYFESYDASKGLGQFIGYPEDIAGDLGLNLVNGSCPGETSASFVNVSAPSNGCENVYRQTYLPKAGYTMPTSQLEFATGYLQQHRRDVTLVTVQVGADDVFLCQVTTADHCTGRSEISAVAQHVRTNMNTILQALRDTGYRGRIVVVTYYSLNYASAQENIGTLVLNSGIGAAAIAHHASIASGFLAFLGPSLRAGGDPRAAGLVYPAPDVHPTREGQQLLARAVEAAIRF